MKGKITKVLTLFVVIGLVISMAIIKNVTTINMSKQNLEVQPQAGMTPIKTIQIADWDARIKSYVTHYGNGTYGGMVWEFVDIQKEFNNLYCVQSGVSKTSAKSYSIYNVYDLQDDSNFRAKFFNSEEDYHHFLYMIENMYLIGKSGNDKAYMEQQVLAKTGRANEYNGMLDEINSMNTKIGINAGNNKASLLIYSTGGSNVIDARDNVLEVFQRYMLQAYIKQLDANGNTIGYGPNPLNANGDIIVGTNAYYGNKTLGWYTDNTYYFDNTTNVRKYIHSLLSMLDRGFDNSKYNVNKYKNFSENNANIDKSNAVYDTETNRVGPFTVTNTQGYSISVSKCEFGGASKSYSVVDANGTAVNLSDKSNNKQFYIQLNEAIDSSNSLKLNFYIDFGDVPTARLFVPNGGVAQTMLNVDRTHHSKNVSWEQKIEVQPDIALKKYVYAVNGSTTAVPARLGTIDLSPLANGTSTNAIYNMNKTPVKVRVGDRVTYAIQIFNEGKVNATAGEITDHLPTFLTFDRAYTDFDAAFQPNYDESNNIENTGSNIDIKLRNPNQNYITPYNNEMTQEAFKENSQIIYVDCIVTDYMDDHSYIYTNMAEITEYRMEAGSDIDSEASNWVKPSNIRYSDEWQDYSNGHSEEDPTWFDNGFHNWGAQDNNGAGDDDDFDKIIIEKVDLALTKRIESKVVNGTPEMLVPENSTTNKSRLVISGYDDVKNGNTTDLRYNMNKKVAHVQKEDLLITVLTVYNEGTLDGVVKEITDFAPTGLNYNAEETAALNGSNVQFYYSNITRELTIKINGNEGITLQNLNDYDNDPTNHKVDSFEVKIAFDVSKAASGRLYNSAAITDYGYVGENGTYFSAYYEGLDRDSYGMQTAANLKRRHLANYGTAENNSQNNLTQFDKNNLQFQDDDDMDVVEVDYNPNFDLSLRKYIQKVEKNFDSDELIDSSNPNGGYKKYSTTYSRRVPSIDEFSVEALEDTGTADYYHDKLKVVTETGDLVTYRFRVYNEGAGDDCFGRATKITDYLPDGLEYVSMEDGNDSNWSASASGSKITLTYTGDKKLPTDSIVTLSHIAEAKEIEKRINNGEQVTAEEQDIYDQYINLDEHDYYQEVGVICRVTTTSAYTPITDRAAITECEAYKKIYDDETNYHLELDTSIEDRDSEPLELDRTGHNPGLSGWYSKTVVDEGTPEAYYPGEEDDDDFDTIYVYDYDLELKKTDGTNLLPGVELKVIKYREISEPNQTFTQTELNDLEDAVNDDGVGVYTSIAPTEYVENDVYIIKEISSVDGYYNPFDGKYIKFSIHGDRQQVGMNYTPGHSGAPLYFSIYEDNGDDDYTNDTYIGYDFRDPTSPYQFVRFDHRSTRDLAVEIINQKIEYYGKYTVKLYKSGLNRNETSKLISGVEFDAEGKFNGGSTEVIPSAGNKLVSSATEPVTVLPSSYTDGYVTINEASYARQDEITLEETGIRSDAEDEDGNPVSDKYHVGLLGKEIKIKINKTRVEELNRVLYYVDSVEATIDGETIPASGYTLDNGSKIIINAVPVDLLPSITNPNSALGPKEVRIDVRIWNPEIVPSGEYTINLSKVGADSPNTLVPGVEFEARGLFNGIQHDIPSSSADLITETTPVKVMPANMNKIDIDPDVYETPDYIILEEKGFAETTEGNAAKAKYHLALKDKEIKVTINKDVDDSDPINPVYYVSSIGLTVDGSSANVTGSGYSWTYNDTTTGAKVEVTYNRSMKNISVKVTNPVKEGKFKLNLIKRKYNIDEDNNGVDDPLEGAVFNVKINDGTRDIKTVTNQTTNANGEIPEISNIDITAENLTYTITVEEVSAPDGYIKLGAPITFTAKSKSSGSKFVLDTSSQPTISNNYIQADVSEDEILIEAEDRVEPIIHKGVKTVENQDSGYDKNEIQNWVINTSVPAGIEDYTKYIVTDTIDPEKTNNAEKRIAFINEANPASNVVVKYKGTNTVLTEGTDYKVSFDTTTKKLTVTFINVTGGTDSFVGGRSLTEDTVLEITYKTQFTLNTNGDPIGLNQRIPNKAFLDYNANGSENKQKESEEPEVHVGGLGVYKYDKSTNQALAGAKFRLVKSEAEAEAAVEALWSDDEDAINNINWVKKYNADGTEGDVWEVTTNSNGYAYFAGLKFGGDASESEDNKSNNGKGGSVVYGYDWQAASTKYYLVETYVPENYVLLEEVAAECEVKYNNFDITDLTTYHSVGNEVVVPEGKYGVEIAKYGRYQEEGQEKELHPIAGVVFSAKRTVNGGSQENLGNLTATDSTGRTLVGGNVVIDKDQVSTNDEYIIKEESVPADSEYYVGLTKDIHLTVSKQSVKSEDKKKWINSVTGISMTIEGETVTEVVAGKKYTATVTKDGQALDITAELLTDETRGQYIKLTVENPHKIGEFPLHLVKTIKGTNPVQKLANAGFKISIKKGTEFVKDKNGNAINGTREYFTDGNGNILIEGIKINKPNETFTVEVEETTVPNGYIGIPNKFTYTVTSVIDGNKLSLRNDDELVVTNDVLVNVEDGEIWNYVENKPEPVIHKGVKTVENQDSGYDGDEVQTWVINTTVPAGIEDYTKYIVTDTIDPEIANNDEKRIEFLGLNTIHVYLKGNTNELVQGEDFLATFDDTTKTMKITFIDGDFKKGQDIPENSIIEIFYNTKFRLDSNGLIIGLNQSIPNQAHLTFNGNGKVEKNKDSETPEVHTGAVGVVKYEDVNKNGVFDSEDKVLEGAHFKIVRSEEEAQRALRAVLANDEATLRTINFVKVRDAEGNPTDTDVELVTGADGTATYEGLEFGKDAKDKESNKTNNGVGGSVVYEYDWETAKSEYYLIETEAPEEYYLLDHTTKFEVSKNSFVRLDLSKYYKESNKPKVYDLSLRKFITHVNGEDRDGNVIDRNITDRIPRVTLTDEFKDKENDEVTTAKYEHTKEPVIVQQGNVVTYTIRIYNEGPEDAYASLVKDDIPDGVKFIPYAEGDGSVNDEYRWKLVDENDNEVSDITKAKYIVTDYLSMEQGEIKDGVNENLIKGFDSDTMNELDYRDLKVQFLVIEPNTSERIITNYAQISNMTNSKGNKVKDRDSTPNEWIEGEDDQDIENIRLLYFDLALRKWVTKAIVTTDGEQKVFETGHKAEDDPEDVVKVDLKKSKLDKVVVKFEYQIRITNEGRIGGWCEEITDHIPDGLVFEQADNPIWAVVDDKTIVTDALKNTYLEPGESAEVTVVLRWVNSGDNLGIKVNVAEISKDRNEYGVHDIDSTPGNYKWGEDDIDDAPVMLAITTGNRVIGYVALGLVVVSIIAVGAVAIKKVRNETQYF